MNIKDIPKIELHLHLDCSLSYKFVSKINPSISYSAYLTDFVAGPKCSNLLDYLAKAPSAIALMQTESELSMSVMDLFEQLAKDRVIYAEIRFAPLEHCDKGLTAEEVVDIVNQAVVKAIDSTGIEARIILCTLRHYSRAQSMQVAGLTGKFKNTHVVALDIAGDEAGYPIDAHVPAFKWARKNHIYCTAHAGEARGAESVWETLKEFKPNRIGHGVRSIEDKVLLEHLIENRIHLEVCPTSNVQTNLCREFQDHPVDLLFKKGIHLGISTDGRTISDINLVEEYGKLNQFFGWSFEHFRQTNEMALDAAFLDEPTKRRLRQKLMEFQD